MIQKAEPLHLQAYQIIRSLLLDGTFAPGERLVEVKLAERLGVSRGPIREAIRMLVQDGLLIENEGPIHVYQPTHQDLIQLFQCRESLEVLAIQLAVSKLTVQQLADLQLNIEQTREAFEQKRFSQVGQLDQDFHDQIIEAASNQQLSMLMNVIKGKIVYIRNTMIRNQYAYLHDFIGEHERIYHALQKRDSQQAETQMRLHIQSSVESFKLDE